MIARSVSYGNARRRLVELPFVLRFAVETFGKINITNDRYNHVAGRAVIFRRYEVSM